jgi:GNAT superfamily N-acetyltransferase
VARRERAGAPARDPRARQGWVDQLYVEPALTGRGIGAALLAVAKRERPGGLRLRTFASNTGAQRFYERHGFAEVLRTDGRDNEERAPDVLYAWPGPGGGGGSSGLG